ncbi:MAG: N-acetylneuraminate synthase family protein [Thermodesulfobacteriota bacterium]
MRPFRKKIMINERAVGPGEPVYFVADIASNHDGDLERAKELIHKARLAGADAVKFQHFIAEKIVSDYGFRSLGRQVGHQSAWTKPVFDIYRQYECNRSWSGELSAAAKAEGIHFFTTPYDMDALHLLDPLVPAWKIGSGDITWTDFIHQVASLGKPVMIAAGASDLEDVRRAVTTAASVNDQLVLLQCNTNYTGSLDNFRHVNLRVLRLFADEFPDIILGLSDHTPGHSAVLGAVTLGASVIEKHFTDDNSRSGPDHGFAMNPKSWREMVDRTLETAAALGDGIKRIEANEIDTVIVQRRCLRYRRSLAAGTRINRNDIEALRPAPEGSIEPWRLEKILERRLDRQVEAGEAVKWEDLEGETC